MDDQNNTTGSFEADEDILTSTVADEAIEAAAGIERGGVVFIPPGTAVQLTVTSKPRLSCILACCWLFERGGVFVADFIVCFFADYILGSITRAPV
jgi:hypothetical protein